MRHDPVDPSGSASGEAPPGETVLGLDNVPIELPIASIGSRVLAVFIDYLIVTILAVVWIVGCVLLMAGTGRAQLAWVVAAISGVFVIDWGYFAGSEIGSGGRTLGKAAFGLQVVTRNGGRPGAAALLVRNLVRTIDIFVGIPLAAIDPLARRLGDRLAGTLVVHRTKRHAGITIARIPRNWDARQVAVMEALLERASELEPGRAAVMAQQLLTLIERDDPAFLDGVERSIDPVETLRRAVRPVGA